MKKKLLSLVLALALCVGVFPTTASAADTGEYDGFTYTIEDGEVSITGCDQSATRVSIPERINNYPVTSIGERAFIYCNSLTSVTIPDSVTTIGSSAFYGCSSLTSVTIPDSVTTIEGGAFMACNSLTDVTIPDSVTTIGSSAFYGCSSLTSVTIPNGVTTIENSTFKNCSSLRCVNIPNTVTEIGSGVFEECSSLTGFSIPYGVTHIQSNTFKGCKSLSSIIIPDTVINVSHSAFFQCGKLTVYFAGSVPTWGSIVFENSYTTAYYNKNDSSWTDFLNSKTYDPYSFKGANGTLAWKTYDGYGKCGDNLTWMACKTDDTTVDGTAYKLIISGTGDMYDFDWTDHQPWYRYNRHTHEINGSTVSGGNYITEVVIEPGVTHIGDSAFAEFCKVEQIVVPEGVKSIGEYAFQYNTSMKVTLPVSLEKIKVHYDKPRSVEYNGCIHQWNSIEEKVWTSVVQCKPNTNQDDGDCTTALSCSVCGGVDVAAQDDHSFTNYVSDSNATCMADGTKTAECDTVGCTETDTVTDVGSKKAHSFTNYVSDNNATCMADGTKTAECDTVGCTETDTVTDVGSKKAHSFTNYVSDSNATCMADGTKTAECDTVGCTETDTVTDVGSKINHDFSNNTEYCRNGCGTKNSNYMAPVMPPYVPVNPTPAPVPAPVKPEPPENPFTDVTDKNYFYKAVLWAAENDITKGTSATTFSPNDTCTRTQAAIFLYNYAGSPETIGANPFTDVQEKDYFYHAVIWAVDGEITKGTSATTFSPDDFCTRAQSVTFLYRYQKD